jgi:hypothetical protein
MEGDGWNGRKKLLGGRFLGGWREAFRGTIYVIFPGYRYVPERNDGVFEGAISRFLMWSINVRALCAAWMGFARDSGGKEDYAQFTQWVRSLPAVDVRVAVSRTGMGRAFSPLNFCGLIPGPLAQAGMLADRWS